MIFGEVVSLMHYFWSHSTGSWHDIFFNSAHRAYFLKKFCVKNKKFIGRSLYTVFECDNKTKGHCSVYFNYCAWKGTYEVERRYWSAVFNLGVLALSSKLAWTAVVSVVVTAFTIARIELWIQALVDVCRTNIEVSESTLSDAKAPIDKMGQYK
jgi:hypothetical protein